MSKKKRNSIVTNKNLIIVSLTDKEKILFVIEKAINYRSNFKVYVRDNKYILKLGDKT